MKYDVIITAAGSGTRTNLPYNKVFTPLNEKPCIVYSVELFLKDADVQNIYITLQPKDEADMHEILTNANIDMTNIYFIYGGVTRQESVYAALKHIKAPYVMIHDGARPFVQIAQLADIKAKLTFDKAAILAIPATDTLKEITATKEVARTINRSKIYYAQTPQAFDTTLINKCHEQALNENIQATDDAQLVEIFGARENVQVVVGSKMNLKITTPDDLFLANLVAKNMGGN